MDGVEYVIRRMGEMAGESQSFILDMHQVAGISESAARLLNLTRLRFSEDNIAVVYSRIHDRAAIIEPLSKSVRADDRGFLSFEDNDLAVDWCEHRLLRQADKIPAAELTSLADSSLLKGLTAPLLEQVEALTRSEDFSPGAQILQNGQAGDGRVFFIQSGEVSILVPLGDGAHQRIASLGPGMEFGEMALPGQTTRSASVYADTQVTCLILEAADLDRLSKQAPQLKITLLENLARDMANKLRGANQWIAALA